MLIDHIAIRANDIYRLSKWYVKHFDAHITHMDLYYVRLSFKNTTLAIIDKNKYPHNHIGILVDNKEDLPTEGERVEHRDGTIGVYCEDPEGNFVEYIYYTEELKDTFVTYGYSKINFKEE